MSRYDLSPGYMTLKAQQMYIDREIERGNMPKASFRVKKIVSLQSQNKDDVLYFWQIHSVLRTVEPILRIARTFYELVKEDPVLKSWFEHRTVEQHAQAQASLWVDCFGAGEYYHGADSRLSAHHNFFRDIMTIHGAERWTKLMKMALDYEALNLSKYDPRLRMAINSFLEFFMSQYATKYQFDDTNLCFGEYIPSISLRGKMKGDLENMPLNRLKLGLAAEDLDISDCIERSDLVKKASVLAME